MSRLVVKNLPSTINSEKLKEHFSSKGVVTDVQLKYTSNGKFRHFGFIGFKTTEEANQAKEYFNNTYINQSKIAVEFCSELGDANKPKAWSKYAPDSSAYKKLHSKLVNNEEMDENKSVTTIDKNNKKKPEKNIDPTVTEKLKKHKDDPMFLEFLEAHSKKGEEETWRKIVEDRDSGVDEEETEDVEEHEEKEEEHKKSSAFASISDHEYMKTKKKSTTKIEDNQDTKDIKPDVKALDNKTDKFCIVKVVNLPFSTKKKDVKTFFHPLKPATIRLPPKSSGFAYVGFKTTKEFKKALNKNKSFLKGKQVVVKEYVTKEQRVDQQIINIKNEKQERWKEQEEALLKEENIAESGSIFVRNLPYNISEDELTQHFASFGPIADVNMPVDKISRRLKGFATVTFVLPEHAVAAYTNLDGTVFHGRMLHLLPAKTKITPEHCNEIVSFKEKKRDKQKASAGQSHNWNSLFLGQNAIADVMAETYNISKQDVLTGSDVAVRMALGETQIVSDTKQFLVDNGVSLDAFNQAPKMRSKTVILVKNLPARSTAAELTEKFQKFGELGRVVLPPSGVTAIVEFLEPSEAKKAFMSLAYTPFKHLPLYLEWAPEDTFSSVTVKEDKADEESSDVNDHDNGKEQDDDLEPEADTTLYVKNLNFNSSEDAIKKHFGVCGRVASVTISRKRDSSKPGQFLSMGYGFVQFYKQTHLNEALKRLQYSPLDGHKLELKRSHRTLQDVEAQSRKKNNVAKQTGTKILVKNVPFQATHNELLQLFQTFGEIKSIHLPKKMVGTGSHRGFAFVEFSTKHDAKRAMQAVCQSTHLYGRRLALEWAHVSEDVDQLRKRTAQHFQPESVPKSKKALADLEVQDTEDED